MPLRLSPLISTALYDCFPPQLDICSLGLASALLPGSQLQRLVTQRGYKAHALRRRGCPGLSSQPHFLEARLGFFWPVRGSEFQRRRGRRRGERGEGRVCNVVTLKYESQSSVAAGFNRDATLSGTKTFFTHSLCHTGNMNPSQLLISYEI